MKKLVIISIIIAVILGFGIVESVVSIGTYKDIISYCNELESELNSADDNILENENVVNIYDKIEKKWNEYKKFALAFSNHVQIKDFTQKLNTLNGYIDERDKKESIVSLYVLRCSAEFMIRELDLNYENIL